MHRCRIDYRKLTSSRTGGYIPLPRSTSNISRKTTQNLLHTPGRSSYDPLTLRMNVEDRSPVHTSYALPSSTTQPSPILATHQSIAVIQGPALCNEASTIGNGSFLDTPHWSMFRKVNHDTEPRYAKRQAAPVGRRRAKLR